MVNIEENKLNYNELFEAHTANLGNRERKLLEFPTIENAEQATAKVERLEDLGFVKCPAGQIIVGIEQGLMCKIEGRRSNETPVRTIIDIPSFYVSKTTVSNTEYEKFDAGHRRPHSSLGDNHPVTCLTYGHAVSYALWLKLQTGLAFRLPTEPEYVMFSAPEGWLYPYQQTGEPIPGMQNTFMAFPNDYIGGEAGTLPVNSEAVPRNHLGIYHPSGNILVYTLGHYQTEGHWGSKSDGAYAMANGGSFRQCALGGRVVTRALIDVAGIADTVGIRLVHDDPFNYLPELSNTGKQ